ncbi:MAG TPA: LysR family transcriptional regulator [Kofleriaceae bacterium]|nr:LysR family transcriptional regulator [Kofleriaceae bacterium]
MDLLAQMATFVRIVDGKSLSAAARAQRVSLAAISRQLRHLEAELGASLIVRSTRKLHVTDAGRQWYAACVRILRELDEARGELGHGGEVRGKVVLSASLTFGMVQLVPHLTRIAERHPRLVVELRLEDQLVDLVAEGVDIAVRAGSPPPDSTAFLAQPIFTMRRVLVAAPRWLRKHGAPRTPAQLAPRACLTQVTPAGTTVRWQLDPDDGGASATLVPDGSLRSNAPAALRALAIDGGGVAYLPDWLVADDLAAGRLRRVLPAWASAPITAWAVYRAELRGSPRLRAVLDALPRDATRGAQR